MIAEHKPRDYEDFECYRIVVHKFHNNRLVCGLYGPAAGPHGRRPSLGRIYAKGMDVCRLTMELGAILEYPNEHKAIFEAAIKYLEGEADGN